MNILKQSTAVDVLVGPFVDSTDGDTEETGLTIAQADVRLSKNGQTAAQKSDVTTCVHDADGFYNCELDATDTDTVGTLVLYVHVSGALAVRHEFQIVEEAVYDAMFASGAVGPLEANDDGSGLTEAGGTGDQLTALATQGSVDTVDSNVDAILLDTAEIGAAGAGLTEAGGTGDQLTALATQSTADAIETDTQDLQSRVPASLNSGRMRAHVEAQDDIDFGAAQKASINTEVDSALDTAVPVSPTAGSINERLKALDDDIGDGGRLDLLIDAIKAVTDLFNFTGGDVQATLSGETVTLGNAQGVQKNAALANFPFAMIDSDDDVSGKTGLTITSERSIDGGAFASTANSATEVGNGIYKIDLAAADLNGDTITLKFTASGANASLITIVTNQA